MYIKALTTKINEDERIVEAIASTSAVDRQGDTIDQSGWELKNYEENPVILFGHNYNEPPIGKALETKVDQDGRLVFRAQFAKEGTNPRADIVWGLHQQGIMRAWSVGFIPLEQDGSNITKSELMEISAVPVPANPEALSFMKSKGFDPNLVLEKSEDEDVPTDEEAPEEIEAEVLECGEECESEDCECKKEVSEEAEEPEEVEEEPQPEEEVVVESEEKGVKGQTVPFVCDKCSAKYSLVIRSRRVGGDDEEEDDEAEAKSVLTPTEAKEARKALQSVDKIVENLNVLLKNNLNQK